MHIHLNVNICSCFFLCVFIFTYCCPGYSGPCGPKLGRKSLATALQVAKVELARNVDLALGSDARNPESHGIQYLVYGT